MSQQDIAEAIGVGRTMVNKMERGKTPVSTDRARLWARRCGQGLEIVGASEAQTIEHLAELDQADRDLVARLMGLLAQGALPAVLADDLRERLAAYEARYQRSSMIAEDVKE